MGAAAAEQKEETALPGGMPPLIMVIVALGRG